MNSKIHKKNEGETPDGCDIETPTKDACLEAIENPFERRDSLSRTPPRMRASSLTDLEPLNQLSNSNKRKKITESPEKQQEITKKNKTQFDSYQNVTKDIQRTVEHFSSILMNMYKPKLEFKEICSKLEFYTEKLKDLSPNEDSKDTLQENEQLKRELKHEKQENDVLKEQVKSLKEDLEKQSPHEYTAQCKDCRLLSWKINRRKVLSRNNTYENFQKVTEDDWKEEIFPTIDLVEAPIWEVTPGTEIILPCSRNLESTNKAVEIAINKFGGKDGLIMQNKRTGEVAMMTHSLGFPNENGQTTYVTRNIYYPIVSDKSSQESEDLAVFQALQQIKEIVLKQNKTKIAIPELKGVEGVILKRMMEYLFEDVPVQVTMYKLHNVNNEPQTKLQRDKIASTATQRTRKPAKTKQDAIIIQMKDKSYADLLKTVRQAVNPSEIGVDVANIAKTKKGDLLLTVHNGSDKTEVLRQEIKNKIPGAKASILVDKKVMHIKGMDGLVTEDEIREAIVKNTSNDPRNFEIRALRPAYGNKQNVTVIMPAADAENLIQMRSIKIGWLKCKIVERRADVRCYRCWEYGHTKSECAGPDRQNHCLKCGKEGHKAGSCSNKPFCIFCKQDDHQSGSAKCRNPKSKPLHNNETKDKTSQ